MRIVGMIILVLLTAISVTLMSEYVIELFKPFMTEWAGENTIKPSKRKTQEPYLWAILIFSLLSFGLFLLMSWLRKKWFGTSAALIPTTENTARKIIIMGLSEDRGELNEILGNEDAECQLTAELQYIQNELRLNKAGMSIDEIQDYRKSLEDHSNSAELNLFDKAIQHPWIQNIRAIKPHVIGRELEYVLIVPSKETKKQAQVFKSILESIFNDRSDTITVEVLDAEASDYRDFTSVKTSLESAIEKAKLFRPSNGGKIKNKDICIDATSGLATFSIGVALATLNHDLLYSYVTTKQVVTTTSGDDAPTGGQVRFYNAAIDLTAYVPE
jgi:hypothetical protein